MTRMIHPSNPRETRRRFQVGFCCSVQLAQALAQFIDDQSYWILGLMGKKLPTIKEGLRIEEKSATCSPNDNPPR